ncbi:UNVERIFIED_CONTAM: hypothetical protein PYX00_000545 [Menopon gallinae]|uniref:Uncharacterized protein n=1 Tax=Menopon gallinae TaxID=328185 RepID=A0AAW2I9L8_9NEOP
MEDSGIDSDPKNFLNNGDELLMQGNLSDSSSSSNNIQEFSQSNVKQLQRKLEQRIQEAKKIQKSQQQEQKKSNIGPNLIPIQRLSIPSKPVSITNKEHLPLVDWDTEDSDEDIHFFPTKLPVKQELTDTFSIEEIQVTPDEDDEDDLNLLPPKPTYQRISICCFTVNSKCIIQ